MSVFKNASANSMPVVGKNNSVLFLLNNFSIGGSELKIVRIANALAKKSNKICIAYLNGPEDLKEKVSPDVTIINLKRRGKFSLSAVLRLRKAIKQYSVRTLFSVNLYPVLYAAALKPVCPNIHWHALINTTDFRSTKEEMWMLLCAPLLFAANKHVFGNRHQLELWKQRYHLSGKKATCIYNGINETYFHPDSVTDDAEQLRLNLGIKNDTPVIGSVGQLRPEKRHDLILEAAAILHQKFPTLRVILVGDGGQKEFLQRRSHELGIEKNVIFLGAQIDVRPALSLMDIFVLASTAIETFSNAALEAMSMGKPLVLSDISGAREMVEEGSNGFVTPPCESAALAERLKYLLDDTDRILNMGTKSRLRIMEQFTFERMLDDYEALIDNV